MPPQFEWPTAEVRADETPEIVALTFVAQIDLAEVPGAGWSPLPKRGTLYFFCSSMFVGEGRPPCRVLYSAADGDAYPDRAPPPDLMPLAGTDGDAQVKWLDPSLDFHSKVEFKYPVSFRVFRDFDFYEDPVGGELMIAELCKALGPGEPEGVDLLEFRRAPEYQKDEHWPFNWLLITHVVRSVLLHLTRDLRPKYSSEPVNDEAVAELKRLRAGAIGWIERCRALTPMDGVDAETRATFRAWWIDLVQTYEKIHEYVYTYPSAFAADLGKVIDHTIRCIAEQDIDALDDVPVSYLTESDAAESVEDTDGPKWENPPFQDGPASDAGVRQWSATGDRGAPGGYSLAPDTR